MYDGIDSIRDINENVSIWGGKAVSLFRLCNAGFQMPEGIVIATYYFREFTYGRIDTKAFSKIINQRCVSFFGKYNNTYMVRSSANVEGDPNEPYSGIFESYLYNGTYPLIDLIKKVWESASSPIAFEYMKNQQHFNSIEMAVIIQEVIHGDYSAVIQSYDVVHNRDRILLEYNGSGIDSIVNGTENSSLAYIFPSNGSIEYCDNNHPSIHPNIIKSIIDDCHLGNTVFGGHVEYEVVFKNSSIIYVQARRII